MVVITMPSISSLIKKLKTAYPQFVFCESNSFLWSHADNTIFFDKDSDNYGFLLHELAHALLNHSDYSRDIELLAMERQAWDEACKLAIRYNMSIDDDFIQSNLDTYRDWLHSRSTCPKCNATGLQIETKAYKCLVCHHKWKVNEARTCSLRRYSAKE